MVTINLASKYSNLIDERFFQVSLTEGRFDNTVDFTGVNTVRVYSIETAPMTDYKRSGMSRFGTPEELGDTVQTMVLSQDRAFTFTIDAANDMDTMYTRNAGVALSRQLNERVIPEVDKYRLGVLIEDAGHKGTGEITRENAYESFLTGVFAIKDSLAPVNESFAFVSPKFQNMIRLDQSFTRAGDLSQTMLINGEFGRVEGIPLISAPTSYLGDAAFLIVNRTSWVSPRKIDYFRILTEVPGLHGSLAEGRMYYDAFTFENKRKAIYVHKDPTITVPEPEAGELKPQGFKIKK